MADTRFHMGWFMNFTTNGMPWNGKFYIEMAQAMEKACFDYIMIEDTLMVSEAYGGTSEAYLKHATMAPKHDPAPLAAIMAAATSKMGVVATMSTTFHPPFMLARLRSTLDARRHRRGPLRATTATRREQCREADAADGQAAHLEERPAVQACDIGRGGLGRGGHGLPPLGVRGRPRAHGIRWRAPIDYQGSELRRVTETRRLSTFPITPDHRRAAALACVASTVGRVGHRRSFAPPAVHPYYPVRDRRRPEAAMCDGTFASSRPCNRDLASGL